ncbi:transglycosylase SLT domain-containing protein [Roseivivax marinus]|uniref:transglycosylase SLT domain-containing protein n=1 Tax=Roseivivax marinus TaxID=1379903 RepID=UPI001F044CF5|nr:transglycosylase SLT domain-containing protein [Roseivivax marinus]UMA65775.1 transglycosylase SLT domain-containing protein [Roseivivax marinus]
MRAATHIAWPAPRRSPWTPLRATAAALLLCLSLPVTGAGPASAQTIGAMSPHPGAGVSDQAVAVSLRPKVRDDRLPKARWGTSARGQTWTRAAVSALRGPASGLTDIVPGDIDTWCPAYEENNRRLREAFWVSLVSALAKHESTYRPTVVGGGGRWHGLLQILPSTARLYGCRAGSGAALQSGAANLSCGLRIMARTVARDGVVSAGMRGVAADWGPFHSSTKRSDMIAYTRSQAFCKSVPGKRPMARPDVDETVPLYAEIPPRDAPVFSTQGRLAP